MKRENPFWQRYLRTFYRGYLFMALTIAAPAALGTIAHFTLANDTTYAVAALSGIIFFALSAKSFFEYRNAECPHCNQLLNNPRNILYPFDRTCRKCGKDLDLIYTQ